jgi:sulfite reductase (NADPH) hemoprotein beta-component
MYLYDQFDHQIVEARVAQFRDQVTRRLSGELTEDEFRILRLQNGLYMQIHAYMLRIAVPYGLLSSDQLRMFAHISKKYDRDYGHFTTRQNIQFNWINLPDAPDILSELATVEMHANQTSGNCIRNITCDEYAGVAQDEIVDPRPYAEILRQWSTFHPEFAFLPRKFKFAITGATNDRAATEVHDIGLAAVKNAQGEVGFRVLVGGGLGRTPVIGTEISAFVPWQHIITYVESVVRVYNQYGRRDNLYKARIKILVRAIGIDAFRREVEADWEFGKGGPGTITQEELERVSGFFHAPGYETLPAVDQKFVDFQRESVAFFNWVQRNVKPHKVPGYASVVLSLKKTGVAPGDVTAKQMDAVAALADRYSFGELRATHTQNLALADVKQTDLIALWQDAKSLGLATPNIGLLTDIICCPGGDFCALANARSIPLTKAISECFDDIDFLHDIGEIDINISGCVNACAHHHIGHIGILGVDKDGQEWYQVSIGGAQGNNSTIGKVIGRAFSFGQVPEVLARLLQVYVAQRHEDERFIDTVRRIGLEPFRTYVYATKIDDDKALSGAEYALLAVGVPYDTPYYSPRF